MILTTRHHDGFSLYDTLGLNDFDALHAPAGRDFILIDRDAYRAYYIYLDMGIAGHDNVTKKKEQSSPRTIL